MLFVTLFLLSLLFAIVVGHMAFHCAEHWQARRAIDKDHQFRRARDARYVALLHKGVQA